MIHVKVPVAYSIRSTLKGKIPLTNHDSPNVTKFST